MISSIIFSTDSLRLGCAHGVKFQWTKNMQDEFDKVTLIFTDQIRLSPYDPSRELNILTDGANSAGIGFVLYQNLDDNDPGKNVTIVPSLVNILFKHVAVGLGPSLSR